MDRLNRIAADLQSLRQLQQASTIFSFEPVGDPAERLTLKYRGQGPMKGPASNAPVEIQNEHDIEIRLPFSYPTSPPDIRWLSAIYHPNVSFSGFVSLGDIGLEWTPDISLDLVCERLWDVVRLAEVNPDRATNPSAKRWVLEQTKVRLPLDTRPLRDRAALANRNVVRYQRRGEGPKNAPLDPDVLYIDDDTQAVPLPPATNTSSIRRRPSDDADVLYIE